MSFDNLYRLEVIGCNRLKHLLETTIATTLPQLEFLTVKRCNELEQVIVMAENGKENNGVAFKKLTTLEVSECEKLKTIFTVSIALPILKTLQLESNAELEHVFGQSDWDSTSQCPSLEDLCVVGCPKICTQWIQNQTTEKMKTIELGYIQGLEELIQFQSQGNDLLTFPCETLYLRNVEELKCIWRGPTNTICFPNLYEIKVIGCNRLKHVFTTAVATSLPNLEKLIVRRCNELEQVIMVEEGDNEANAELTKEVGFQNLSVLHVSNCEKLKTIFSMFISLPVLDCLRLESNAELESVFGQSDSDCTSQWAYLNVLSVTGCSNLGTHSIAFLTSQLQPHSTAKKMRIINLSNIQGVEELVHFQEEEEEEPEDDDSVDEPEDGQILKLEEVGELKRIWSGPTQNISFSFLGAIRVIGCNRLKQVFTTTMASTLHNLALFFVESCHDLEQVIVEDGNEDSNVQLQLELPSLKLLRLIYLPKLVSFCPSSCNFVFPPLTEETMQVEGCPKPVTDFFSKISYQNDDKVNDDDGDRDEDNDDGNEDDDDGDDDNDDGDEDGDDGDKDEDGDDDGNYTEKSVNELLGIY